MQLCKSTRSNIIHSMNPLRENHPTKLRLSFCGKVSRLSNFNLRYYDFYEGLPDLVTCKTCKRLMQVYMIKKLQQKL